MPDSRIIATPQPATVVTSIVKIDGTEIARTFQVEVMDIRKEINRIPVAKLVLVDGDASEEKFSASNESLFIPGKEIELLAGYQSDNYPLFKGIIIKHSIKIRANGAAVLQLECRDKTIKMTVARKSKYFTDEKDSDIITEICSKYGGITATAESTSVTHKEVVQYEATDWDFILSRADVNGKMCFADDGILSVKAPDLAQSSALTLVYGATITELDAEIDARHQLKAITSKSWNYSDQKISEVEAKDPAISLNGNLSSSDLAAVLGIDKYQLDHGGKLSEGELQAWCDAMMLRHQLAKVRGRVKFKGIHTIKPGMLIQLSGLSDRFNGKAFVSGVHHSITAGDWQLDVQFGLDPEWFAEKTDIHFKPASSLLPGIHGLQIAKVTRLEGDPDGEDRIQIRLPIIGEEEGIWSRIATLDAGKERGSFFMPEVDDEVIVGFLNGDPRQAVILGMVHSSSLAAPLKAKDANPQKGFVTRSKMKMIFDDEKKSFTLETPKGKKIILDEEGGIISFQDENQNKLTMDSSGIIIESKGKIQIKATQDLSFEGMNLSLKGQASLKAEGSASAEVSSSGTTTIKGSMVMIN